MRDLDSILLVLLLLNYTAPLFLLLALWRKNIVFAIPALVFSGLMAIVGPEMVAFTFGAGFGPGSIATLLACPYAFILVASLIGLAIAARDSFRQPVRHPLATVSSMMACFFVVVLPIVPAAGGTAIRGHCDARNRLIGDGIVGAMNAYHSASGQYPQRVEWLAPGFLSEIPTPECFDRYASYGLASWAPEAVYEIVQCKETVLTVPDLSGGFPQRYNFGTGEWSKVSFLDGVCYFPEPSE